MRFFQGRKATFAYPLSSPLLLSQKITVMSLAPAPFHIDNVLLFQGKELFRALNHPLRQQMIQMIHMHGRMTVTQLFTKMGLEQSVTSNHLALLRAQKLLLAEKQQKFVFYSLNYGRLKKVQECVANYLGKLTEAKN
jgi:DNA-binding transcriptional ArsR family regulator